MSSTLTVDLFVSLDGWAGSDGLPGYFGYGGPDLERWIAREDADPHVSVMGRRTHELLARLPAEHRDDGWQRMARRETVVFSRTLTDLDWPAARVVRDDPVAELTRLRASGDRPLRTVGSLSLVRQLLAGGVVDRLRLMVFPLLAGPAGREPALGGVVSADLELVGHEALDGRLVLLEYRPTLRDIPRA